MNNTNCSIFPNSSIFSLILLSPIYLNHQFQKKPKKKQKKPSKISFLNKGLKFIKISGIFHDILLKACLFIDIRFDHPTVVFSLIYPIRSKILGLNQFIRNVDVKALLQDNSIFSCNCEGSGSIKKDPSP